MARLRDWTGRYGQQIVFGPGSFWARPPFPGNHKVLDLMIERMDENAGIVARFINEPEFQKVAFRELARRIYEEARCSPRS